jgi:hypothetical protein
VKDDLVADDSRGNGECESQHCEAAEAPSGSVLLAPVKHEQKTSRKNGKYGGVDERRKASHETV